MPVQGGITCGAIEDPRKSSKAIDERVIINFRDKNAVIARFRDKNFYRQLFCSINSFFVLSIAFLFYRQLFCSINMANIFEFLSKDGNITPEKARKSRQMPFHDKTAYVWMGMLPLKKRVNRDKCSFATKQRMFGVFAIDEILRYRGSRIPGSPTLCHPVQV